MLPRISAFCVVTFLYQAHTSKELVMGYRSLLDQPTRKTNRLKARTPTTGRYWCGCDAALRGVAEKCRYCGYSPRGFMRRRELP